MEQIEKERILRKKHHECIYKQKQRVKQCIKCDILFSSILYPECKKCRPYKQRQQYKKKELISKIEKNISTKKINRSNYKDSKIYKIISPNTDLIYIGATCTTLDKRFKGHKLNYNYNQYRKSIGQEIPSSTSSKYILETSDNCLIELIELFPCDNKYQLDKREKYYIQLNINVCVNIQHSNIDRTIKQDKIKLEKEKETLEYEEWLNTTRLNQFLNPL